MYAFATTCVTLHCLAPRASSDAHTCDIAHSAGPRRAVDAVLLAMRHNVPHVLLLRDSSGFCRLPGGKLKPGEGTTEGLKRNLSEMLSPPADSPIQGPVWVSGTPIGTFWRPSFDSPLFPYKPAHVSEPKETRTVYLVPLPETAYFAPPANLELIAVPLHELYDNTARFGSLIAAVPVMLSSVQLNAVQSVEKTEA